MSIKSKWTGTVTMKRWFRAHLGCGEHDMFALVGCWNQGDGGAHAIT